MNLKIPEKKILSIFLIIIIAILQDKRQKVNLRTYQNDSILSRNISSCSSWSQSVNMFHPFIFYFIFFLWLVICADKYLWNVRDYLIRYLKLSAICLHKAIYMMLFKTTHEKWLFILRFLISFSKINSKYLIKFTVDTL